MIRDTALFVLKDVRINGTDKIIVSLLEPKKNKSILKIA